MPPLRGWSVVVLSARFTCEESSSCGFVGASAGWSAPTKSGEVLHVHELPIGAFAGAKSLRFYPDIQSREPRWEEYREKWDCLGRVGRLED